MEIARVVSVVTTCHHCWPLGSSYQPKTYFDFSVVLALPDSGRKKHTKNRLAREFRRSRLKGTDVKYLLGRINKNCSRISRGLFTKRTGTVRASKKKSEKHFASRAFESVSLKQSRVGGGGVEHRDHS